MSIELVMPSNHLILCRPLLLLPSIFPSIRVFSNEPVLHIRWPKYWSFSFNINPSNDNSGLIPFRMDWLDLLAVQGTLKSQNSLMDSDGEGEGEKIWENGIETCKISCMKRVASPCDPQKSPDTPGSPEGNTEGPGTASSEPLLPS